MEYPRYQPQSDLRPLSDEELGDLDELLADLPAEGALNIEAMDGFLTALLLTPQPLAERDGADWLPEIWGGDGEGNAPFASGKQKKRVMMDVLRHVRALEEQLFRRPNDWQPIFSIADHDDGELTDAEDWCIGFMIGVDLAPEAWEERFNDEELGQALMPIALLGGDDSQLPPEEQERMNDPALRDALSREIPDAILALAAQQAH